MGSHAVNAGVDEVDEESEEVHTKKSAYKTPYDERRTKIERLMANPEKPAYIPNPSKEYKPRKPFEFIRNVWGSSAGVGSGDFHVYRGIRRREYERQAYHEQKTEEEKVKDEFQKKVAEIKKQEEDKAAKKRAKRLKKKNKLKGKQKDKKSGVQDSAAEDTTKNNNDNSHSNSSDDNDDN